MNGKVRVAGLVCCVLAGMAGADFIATSLRSDGAVLLSSSGSDENGSVSSRVMAVDEAQVIRSLAGRDDLVSDLVVHGTGPVLFSEYAEYVASISGRPDPQAACSFLDQLVPGPGGGAFQYVTGIVQAGDIESSRVVGEGLAVTVGANGSGMVLFGSAVSGNRTLQSHGFVAGNLSVQDRIRYGVRI